MKNMRVLITVAALIVAITCSAATGTKLTTAPHAGEALIKIRTGASFVKTRSRLLQLGWQPVRMHSTGNYEYDGAEKRLVERGFMEVDSCSVDRGANCILYYRKGSACLRLDTVGEQVAWMKISSWTAECPSSTE